MLFRASCAAIAAALMLGAVPAAAQQFSDSYEFLEAIRKADGAKVNKYLQDKGLRIVNTRDRESGEGAIHIVTRREDLLYLRVVLQQDEVNVNLQDRRGNTALLLAADRGWSEGVDTLVKYGANVNLPNAAGETPLIRAVQAHDERVVAALLKAGADPDRADFLTGKSARDYARDNVRYPGVVKLLNDAPKAAKGAAGPRL